MLGTPPSPEKKMVWTYYDKDNHFHSWSGTPKEFSATFARMARHNPSQTVALINDPRHDYGKVYTVDRMQNISGGQKQHSESQCL